MCKHAQEYSHTQTDYYDKPNVNRNSMLENGIAVFNLNNFWMKIIIVKKCSARPPLLFSINSLLIGSTEQLKLSHLKVNYNYIFNAASYYILEVLSFHRVFFLLRNNYLVANFYEVIKMSPFNKVW